MSKPFKVNLSADWKDRTEKHKLPKQIAVSPKLDGIRFYVTPEGVALSRSNKPLANEHFQAFIFEHRELLNGVDGEVLIGEVSAPDVYNRTSSVINSKSKEGEMNLRIFDLVTPEALELPFHERFKILRQMSQSFPANVELVTQVVLTSDEVDGDVEDQMAEYEALWLSQGYEGMMVRDWDGKYKQGRSTLGDMGLIKVKRFVDTEGTIVGFVEQMENTNPKQTNELGQSQRSTKKEGLVPKGTLGTLEVSHPEFTEVFEVGTGFTKAVAQEIWDNREDLVGKLIKFKYFPHGVKDKPRHPVFLGFRDPNDC